MTNTFGTALIFNINVIMGSGALAMPYAFYISGYVLGTITLGVFAFLSYVTISYNFEAQMRIFVLAKAWADRKVAFVGDEDTIEMNSQPMLNPGELPVDTSDDDAETPLMVRFLAVARAAAKRSPKWLSGPAMVLLKDDACVDADVDFDTFDTSEFWEINDVLLMTAGRAAVWGWNACNVAFQLAVLWTFCVVLGATATIGIPIAGVNAGKPTCNTNDDSFAYRPECMTAIRIWFVIFASLNLVLVAQDWKFMATLQRVLAVLVYICLGIIVVTCIIAMTEHDFPGAKVKAKSKDAFIQDMPIWKMSGFAGLFGICVFALLCHSATSFILKQMPRPHQVKAVFRAAFCGIFVIYTALGLVVAFYIGNRVEKVATLDWSIYNEWGAKGWIGTTIGNVVLFFPILSITPGFVLRTRSLTEAVEAMVGSYPKRWISKNLLRREYRRSTKGKVYRFQVMLRVAAVAIALCCSMISYHFHQAIEVTSFAGFTILFLFPILSQAGSKRALQKLDVLKPTPFDDVFSSNHVLIALGTCGGCAFIYFVLANFVLHVEPIATGLGNVTQQ